jgi:MFS family permease
VDPVPVERGQLRAGLRYVRARPGLVMPLAMMAVIGCLAYEFQVSLPYMASNGLNVGASGYGFMMAAMSVGAVIGGLVVATRGRTGTWPMVFAAAGGGVAMTLAALAPNLTTELLVLAFLGAANISFMSIGNATLQLRAAPNMRGRVMSLWYVAFQGSTPIGGPVVGAVMSGYGARAGLGLGAAACVVVAVVAALVMRARGIAPGRAAPPAPQPVATARQPATAVLQPATGQLEPAATEELTRSVPA